MKICKTCGKELPATSEFFKKEKRAASGLTPHCIDCLNERRREIRKADKERILEVERNYRERNKDRILETRKEYYEKNRTQIIEKSNSGK